MNQKQKKITFINISNLELQLFEVVVEEGDFKILRLFLKTFIL
jgi:hypothetical protein